MTATPTTAAPAVVQAAGALIWREQRGRLEVALVHRPRYRDWSWPKGKLDPGEPVAAAAVREVAEETGEQVVLGAPLPLMRYRTPDGGSKQVRYWAARVAEQTDAPALAARAPVVPAKVTEIDDVIWVSAATARQMLSHGGDTRPLDALEALATKGRLDTRVLAIARHGQAVPRTRWKAGEASRPLTGVGRRQAETVVPVLAAFGIRRVVSSPWRRCLDTMGPYLDRAGLGAQSLDALTESAHAANPKAVADLVDSMLAWGTHVALATHRPVLPTVLDTLAESTRRWTHGSLPGADPYLRTGELLVAHVTGVGRKARVVAVEHHRPVRMPAAV